MAKRSFTRIRKRQTVLRAVAEYDQTGPEQFLQEHGYQEARNYFLVVNGKEYPSKAILGVAYRYEFPGERALASRGELHGGKKTVKPKLEELGFEVRVRRPQKVSKRAIGRSYVPSDEKAAREKREPFAAEMDPDVIDRGRLGHKRTQNLLADLVREHHLEPLRPSGEPQFDVAWWNGDRIYVAEVKSLTKRNEEKQLRLGLGQVLRYRQLLREKPADAWAVLALEREPGDKGWLRMCRELDVILWWPGAPLPPP